MHILWLKTELLHPIDKGGRIRTYALLRELVREHAVTYLTLDDGLAAADAVERASEYSTRLVRVPFRPPRKGTPAYYGAVVGNLFSGLPYAVARYRSSAMEREIIRYAAGADIVVCDFLAPAINVPARPGRPCVLFEHNVEATIWERHAQVARHLPVRLHFRAQWRRMARFEAAACRRFDEVIAVSAADASALREAYGLERVSVVETGVDLEYFARPAGAIREPREIVFLGSMDWMPNQDAVRFFVADVLPRVHAMVPDARFRIVGRNPPPAVRALADPRRGIEVTGSVADVRPYLTRAAVCVVPLRVGGGTRLKVYEAMAMEVPVVSTSIGMEGLPLAAGRELLVADEAEGFATAVVQLLREPAVGAALAAAAVARVRRDCGWRGVAASFAEICRRVVAGAPTEGVAA